MFATIAPPSAGEFRETFLQRAYLRLSRRFVSGLRILALSLIAYIATLGAAYAACTVPSTLAGASIAFTLVGQTVSICITNDQAKWGLFPALNVQSNFNAPIGNTAGTVDVSQFSYADYTYTTSKAVYKLHPVQGSTASGADEIQVTLQSQSGSAPDSMNLYSSSWCTDSSSCSTTPPSPMATRTSDGLMFPSGPTDTLFLLTVTSLPVVPTVAAVAPSSGAPGGGTAVTITGTGFTGATGVTFGGVAATSVTVVNDTTVTANTPAHAVGAVDVVVTTPAGSGTGTNLFTYAAAPTVASISPTSGPAGGGTPVTITGTNFINVTAVTVGGNALTGVTVVSATTITGTTASHAAGTVNVVVTTPGGTGTGTNLYTYVTPPPLNSVAAVPSTTLTAGTAASFTPVTASGGLGTLSYALSGGTLPTGLTFSTTNGLISGTPSTLLATTTFTVTVTDQNTPTAQTSSKTFDLTVNPPALTTTQAVPTSTLTSGTAASFTPVTASGGFGTLSYALSGGTLPTGLSFAPATGVISGTPTTLLGATTFTVTVTDQTTPTGQTSAKTFSLTVSPPALTTTQAVPTTTLTAGTAASFTPVTASGGFGTLSYALSGGTLPTGLSFLTTTGQITGTPSTLLAATTFTVTVTDQTTPTAQTSAKTFSLTVNAATLATVQAMPAATLTAGTAATPFTPVTASGGFGTLSYALSGGTLPTGLSFATTTGQITGTPSTLLAATTFTVTVTDQTTPTAQTSAKTFSLTVNAATLATVQAVATTTLTVGTAATPFTPVTASGGFGTLSYTLSGGTLPTGLSFSTITGQITGTPSTLLSATTFTVTVTDQATPTAQTSFKTFSLTVGPLTLTTTQAIATNTLTAGTLATTFTPVTASGGFGTLSYALSGGTLPTGLSFATTTGQISGTPSTLLAATTFTVTVTDQTTPTAQTSFKTFSLTVNAPALATVQAVATTTLTTGTAATPFTAVTASGGFGTLSYALSGGTLPTGLSFATTTGQITGTPSTLLAATTFTVTVTDQATPTAQTSFKTFSLTVNAPALATVQAVATTTLTAGTVATPFTPVTASGGFGTLSYALSGGTLPTGLSFATTTGQITGTPSTLLTATTFTVTVTDQATPTAQTSLKTFSLTVIPAAPTVTVISPNSGAAGGGVSVTITGTNLAGASSVTIGGTAVATFSIGSATSITATTAAHAAGVVDVVVTTPGGSGTGTGLYTYVAAPTVTSIAPNAGPTSGGSVVTITGSNFTGATAVTIGGVAATGITVISAATISATTPAHVAGSVDVVVTTPSGTGTGTNAFTYTAAPAVTSIAPPTGPATGGVAVIITGSGFTGATSVTIGGVAATAITVVSATTITATTAAHAAGVVDVVVITPGGTGTGSGIYTYSNLPTVASVSPATGPTLGGTSVTITGTNFTGATGITFGGAAATGVTVVTATTITAVTPGHAAGPVDVVVIAPGGSGAGTGLFTYAVPATTTTLTSSKNPSEAGQAVTFTASVSASGTSATGTVTFNDGGVAIGSATLAGGAAAFTTTSLAIGNHTITAAYAGNAGFQASSSAPLIQSVNMPQDSLKLRALQIIATKAVSQASGAAISGAIDTAIAEGFSDGGNLVTPNAGGMRFNFSADPDQQDSNTADAKVSDRWNGTYGTNAQGRGRASSPDGRPRVDDAFAAIDRMAVKAPSAAQRYVEPKDWMLWGDIKGSGISRWGSSNTASVLYGNQVNALLGLTRKLTPNFLIGALGGYEIFDYRSDTLNGRLKGDGWTLGSYAAWKLAAGLRFDAAVAYSGIGYDGTAGIATGNFNGHRWLVSGGITGTTQVYGLSIEPSARVYALWEHQNAYTDSLGTPQDDRNFFNGRASAGVNVGYPWLYSATVTLVPYAGVYADYYFTGDDAATVVLAGAAPLASVPLLDGWSARAAGGLGARFDNGTSVAFGAELGGLGGNVQIWTFRGRASVPF